MKSPFKFLDAYTPEDKAVFFGRERETETLYQLVYKSRLIMVYGQSGTGKTSLVQCGLGGRFDLTDWYPFWIRRNEDINRSLRQALAAPAGGSLRQDSLTATLAWLYKTYLRPVYLIFDQLEELFILGGEAEQQAFIEDIHRIQQAELPCKILLVMREEYIARLYHFEQVVPSLFDRRLRVEPMNYTNAGQVIRGSCAAFNIRLREPEENVRQIIDYVSGGRSGIPLPYLQVYLDRLWQDGYVRTYGSQGYAGEGIPPLEFTREEIQALGAIEDVLEKFLEQQKAQIQEQLQREFPGLGEGALGQLLDLFVTEEGTKQPVAYRREQGELRLEAPFGQRLEGLPPAAVQQGLEALERARILRFTGERIELAHDSLAELIDQERSSEQRQLNQVKRRIAAAYVEYRESGIYLSARQLAGIEPYLPQLQLDEQLEIFIQQSYADAERREQAETQRRERELQLARDKLAAEQQARKRQRIFTFFLAIALLLALASVGWALKKQQEIAAEKVVSDSLRTEAENNLQALQAANARQDSLQADKVMAQVEDILQRARSLQDRYLDLSQYLRQQADSILASYPENDILQQKRQELKE